MVGQRSLCAEVSQWMTVKNSTRDRIERAIGNRGSSASGTPSRLLTTTCQKVPLTRVTAEKIAEISSAKSVPLEWTIRRSTEP